MLTITLLKALERYVVFDTATFKELTGASSAYAWLQLHRLKTAGYVFEIQRDKYSVYKDPFLIASRIVWPSYISLWSTLRYWGMTEQLPTAIWVVTTRRGRTLEYQNTAIFFTQTKPKYLYGFKKISWQGFDIFIADREKTLIDGLLFKKIPFVEIASALRIGRRRLNIQKLVRYAIRSNNNALIKRLGYLLERQGVNCYNKFKKYIYPAWTPFDWAAPPKGQRNKKWRIILNVRWLCDNT
jgi:predicted transcriptional regulator of viral defense system